MRIVLDVAPLSHQRTGVGNYIRGSLQGIAAASAGKDELVAFAPVSRTGRRLVLESLDGIDADRRLPVLPLAHAVRTVWSKLGTPPVERVVGGLDVFHFSDWMYPPQRGGMRSTMVHDLVPLHHPEWVHARTRRMHGAKYLHAARVCDVVIVNSHFTAADVAETLAVPRERIHVAYPGVDERLTPEGPKASGEYLLAVGTLEPRKNLGNAVSAARRVGIELRVVGPEGWGGVEACGPGVTWLGYHGDLGALYRGAAAFVYPSRFEGFGMPVIEAMACGVPCVVSSHPSLDEACGEAAVRVDPDDVEAIAAGVERAVSERAELVRRGLEHSRSFTWLDNGRAHLDAWAST